MGRVKYGGIMRCPQCRMFNRTKDQCVFCDADPGGVGERASAGGWRAARRGLTPRMTPRVLADICKEHDAPTCNLAVVQLHLNCIGFEAIDACVSHYPAVECLWLERNKLARIENLEALTELRCLGLNNNALSRVEGVSHMARLTMLNLSGNSITRLEGLDSLKSLSILLVADNLLRRREDIEHLERCLSVEELDLGGNRIDDVAAVEVLERMPALRVLVLERNPVADYNGRIAVSSSGTDATTTTTGAAAEEAKAKRGDTSSAACEAYQERGLGGESPQAGGAEDNARDELGGGAVVMTSGGGAWGEDETTRGGEDEESLSTPAEAPETTPASLPAAVSPTVLPNYRRALVARLRQLHALDHRPINPQEREYCERWWQDMNGHTRRGEASASTSAANSPLGAPEGGALTSDGAPGRRWPDGNEWPVWVLHEVFTRGLTTKEVTFCAECSSVWREGAAACLTAARRSHASSLMEAALPDVAATEDVIPGLTWHDFEDLRSSHVSLKALVHLFYCVATVWPLYWDEALAAAVAQGRQRLSSTASSDAIASVGRDGDESPSSIWREREPDVAARDDMGDVTATAAALMLEDGIIVDGLRTIADREEEEWLAAALAASAADSIQRVPDPEPEPEPPGLPLPPEPSSEEVATTAAAARTFILNEGVDLDNATWRAQAWTIVVEPMLGSPRFPGLLLDCAPVLARPERLAKLRASTGSADDMEDYVPLLESSCVSRVHGPAGRLAAWLMAREAHAHAALCVSRAGSAPR